MRLWPHLVAQRRFLVRFLIGVAGFNIFSGGYLGWIAPFFQRTYGWTTGRVGVAFGVAVLGCGILGALTGGWLTSRLTRASDKDAVMKVSLGCAVVIAPFAVIAPLAPVDQVAFAGLVAMLFVLFGRSAIIPAAVLNTAPPELHARAGAVALLVAAVLGTGCGPAIFALVTDHVFHDPAKLRYSLSIVSAIAFGVVIGAFALAERRYAAAIGIAKGRSA